MPFRKSCHMSFLKLIPSFTLTDVKPAKKNIVSSLTTNKSKTVSQTENNRKAILVAKMEYLD